MTTPRRPATEAEAASDFWLFTEWLRATGRAASVEAMPQDDLAAAVERYVSVGDPVRAAAIRADLLRRARPATDAP